MNYPGILFKKDYWWLSFFSLLLATQACEQGKQEQQSFHDQPLLGQWEAEWHTKSLDGKNQSMKGELYFTNHGKVKVMAYGYQGCYFMSDTSTNEMTWELNDDTLHLHVANDDFGFDYQVRELHNDQVKLSLLEDIYLDLRRLH